MPVFRRTQQLRLAGPQKTLKRLKRISFMHACDAPDPAPTVQLQIRPDSLTAAAKRCSPVMDQQPHGITEIPADSRAYYEPFQSTFKQLITNTYTTRVLNGTQRALDNVLHIQCRPNLIQDSPHIAHACICE